LDHVEVLHLVGDLEVDNSLSHQVGNTNATNFSLLHRVVGGVGLGALLLDKLQPFVRETAL
jgi:hypothetical protein